MMLQCGWLPVSPLPDATLLSSGSRLSQYAVIPFSFETSDPFSPGCLIKNNGGISGLILAKSGASLG